MLDVEKLDVNATGIKGKTALMYAVILVLEDVVDMILKHDEINLRAVNELGSDVMHFAASRGSRELCDLFMSRGLSVRRRNNEGQTAFYAAAKRGQVHMLDFLVEHGADPDVRTEDGNTPLHGACYAFNIGRANNRLTMETTQWVITELYILKTAIFHLLNSFYF